MDQTNTLSRQLLSDRKSWSAPGVILDLNPRYMEPFTSGVMCVGLGYWSTRLTQLTKYWPHEWIVSAKLGTETQYYCPDSTIVQKLAFDHINENNLLETLKQFMGTIKQLNPPPIPYSEPLLVGKETNERTINTVIMKPKTRIKQCFVISLLDFNPPNIKLKVISDGYFSCRQFIHDLGLQLNSCAHLTDLCLNQMGIITVDDCLKKYEIHLKQMEEAIDKYSKILSKDLKKFTQLKPDNRRFI
ncbi:tRNA pseudouridine synthase B-like isoform X2 [Oppia nitens]|uniref:tRNA pseudouridine synthase B-like isoform X2 n=1 Tax=Oppia nitens TaxID=1686743 RepID=UPI0023DB9205|nr:tRNA pseudouridine synthase B-like isoform X2 [Oppia nitens]